MTTRGNVPCPFRGAVQAGRVGLWDWHLTTGVVVFSSGWKRQLGYQDSEIPDELSEWESRVHEDDLPLVRAAMDAFVQGRAPEYRIEFRMRHKDGSWRWIASEASLVLGPDGRPVRAVGTHVDVTEQRSTVAELGRSNRALRMLIDSHHAVLRGSDEASLLGEICRIAVEVGGYRMAWVGLAGPGEARPVPVANAGFEEGYLAGAGVARGEAEDEAGIVAAAMATGLPHIARDIPTDPRFASRREAALSRGYQSAIALPLLAAGRPFGVLKIYSSATGACDPDEVALLEELACDVAQGVTSLRTRIERDRATEALRAAERQFRTLSDAHPDFLSRFDAEGRFVLVNASIQRNAGITPDALLGRTPLELGVCERRDDDVALQESLARVVREGKAEQLEVVFRTRSGPLPYEVRHIPERDGTGEVVSVLGIARDLSERSRLEDQLRQSQKMEAVGQLAGGIAHDFNNLLAVIRMQAALLDGETDPSEIREGLGEIVAATERAANLTRQLLTFSRRQVTQPVDLDIRDSIGTMLKLLRRILGEDVALETRFAPSLPMVNADPGMVEQIVMNLAVNARDAMPDGGRLTVELDVGEVSAERAAAHPGVEPGRHVRLAVTDTGHGVPAADLPRIFEPFFTTKDPGRGTGLGLATVFGIVRQHHGFIEVASDVGRGARFEVFLPAVVRPAAERPGPAPSPTIPGGTETILVVEDEAALRHVTRLTLERRGYRVLSADSAQSARATFEASGRRVDLLLTDLVLPGGTSGSRLAEELIAREPGLKVLYTTGYSKEISDRQASAVRGWALLQKPYDADTLALCVRRRLDAEP